MLAGMAQRKPDPAVVFADGSFICCIEFMANVAVGYVWPQAYHFRMIQCAWRTPSNVISRQTLHQPNTSIRSN